MLEIAGMIALVIIVALVVMLIYASTRPDTFRLERSASVNAPPEKVFPLINDYKNWALWSPYENKDPAMKRTFSGAPAGRGAVYEWDGNKNVGTGRMEIVDTAPPNKIIIKLDFLKPFEGHNVAEFTMEPQDASTNVTWAMHGPVPFIGKILHLCFNMDKMIGNDFAAGLAKLKIAAEK